MNKNIIVSVCMITYNHENYIREAIEGVLMQETNFPVELIIGEDCSTDETRNVCIEYANKHPELIRLLLPQNNLGVSKNFIDTLEACTGKYIAICEGDDYWTDSYKLQKQVDILERNNGVVACVTNSSIVDLEGKLIQSERMIIPPTNKTGIYNLHDFFQNAHQYPTLTVVFRNQNIEEISHRMEILKNPFLGDWILWVLLFQYGQFYFMNEVTAAYRMNPSSLTHTVNAVNRWKQDFVIRRKLIELLPAEYHSYLKSNWYSYYMIGMAYRKQKKYLKLFYYFIRSFLCHPSAFLKQLKSLITNH